jgi:hypothetical protein
MFNRPTYPKLPQRADNAAKQMRYFRIFSQKGSFSELRASAERAGFEAIYEETTNMDAGFRWAADGDHPDFTFHVSFEYLGAVSVTAKSFGDIFGLVMNSISNLPKISIEIKPSLEEREIGRNARQLRKILLAYSDFDRGFDEMLGRL